MHPEPGVSLVTGALQSSILRAQRIPNGSNLPNSIKGKKLKDYCDSIGSSFSSYTNDQFLELGKSLTFIEGGNLERTIPEDIRDKCVILKQENAELDEKKICDKLGKTSPSPNGLFRILNSKKPQKSGDNGLRSVEESKKKPNLLKQFDTQFDRILNSLKDNTIAKSKRNRLLKKLRKLKKLKDNGGAISKIDGESTSKSAVKQNKSSTIFTGKDKYSDSAVNSKKLIKMTPESVKTEVLTNGTNGSGNKTSSSPSKLPEPKQILYPKEMIALGWKQNRSPGAGFHNFGNTCYLNSSLQALFHIPAFVNWIQQGNDQHRNMCSGTLPNQTACIICVVYITLQEYGKNSGAIRPRVLDKLKAICKHFSYGRQEDAHEFLRYLLEGMERSYLSTINGLGLDNRTKETNPLGQIFGGYIRTEVTCLKCGYVSTTFQPSAELQLDIRHSTTLEDALQLHFRKERLDNNDYKCEKCRTISQATKQFSLEVPPLVLCLQLKRFTLFGNKISKRIHCNKMLNMTKYLHKSRNSNGYCPGDNDLKYRLVALVTHLGQSPNCGHYTAIAEVCNGSYYQFDDQFVHEVSSQTALNNDAYVIIYEMDKNSLPNSSLSSIYSTSSKPCTVTSATVNSPPSVPKKFVIPFSKTNGNPKPNLPVKHPPVISNTDAKFSNLERPPVRFGLNGNFVAKPTTKINILKTGLALTNSSKIYNPVAPTKQIVPVANCVKLVPYGIDNDSDKEDETVESVSLKEAKNADAFPLKETAVPEQPLAKKEEEERKLFSQSQLTETKSPLAPSSTEREDSEEGKPKGGKTIIESLSDKLEGSAGIFEKKSILSWDGTENESALSKSIGESRKRAFEDAKNEFEEELDEGKVKKRRKSRSPLRNEEKNQFQTHQDRKAVAFKWNNILDGYGKDYRDHHNAPGGRKPWNNNNKKFRDARDTSSPRGRDSSGNRHNFNSYSSFGNRNNCHNNHRRGYQNYNGDSNRNHHYNKNNWRNHYNR